MLRPVIADTPRVALPDQPAADAAADDPVLHLRLKGLQPLDLRQSPLPGLARNLCGAPRLQILCSAPSTLSPSAWPRSHCWSGQINPPSPPSENRHAAPRAYTPCSRLNQPFRHRGGISRAGVAVCLPPKKPSLASGWPAVHDPLMTVRGVGAGSVVLAALVLAVPAEGARQPDLWLRTTGGWEYCTFQPAVRVKCFSTVTGRWIEVRSVRRGEQFEDVATTGTDRRLIGVTRAVTHQSSPLFDGRPGETWLFCAWTAMFLKCHAGDRGFWVKKDGSYRMNDSVRVSPFG